MSSVLSATLLAFAPLGALAQEVHEAGAAPTEARAASATYDLGAVLAKRGDGGLTIMAVTPGGSAERMKLRAGDRLLSLNGVSLETLTPTSTVRQALEAGGSTARMEVARDGRTFVVDGAVLVPAPGHTGVAIEGCGYVTGQGPTPTLSENIFPLDITKVAGSSTRLHPVNRHRVDAGRQVLVVFEEIPPTRFSTVQLVQRQRMLRQLDARAYKVLIVDVEPGMKYHVGAQLLPDRMGRQEMLDNEYWRPVVWKEVPERCR